MSHITQLAQLDLNANYSYADYLSWRLEETIELIRGRISLMSPAPSLDHQRVSWQLSGLLFEYFRKKTAVRLPRHSTCVYMTAVNR